MTDALSVELEDGELHAEIELVGALMVATLATDGPLSQAEVDDILRTPGAVTSS